MILNANNGSTVITNSISTTNATWPLLRIASDKAHIHHIPHTAGPHCNLVPMQALLALSEGSGVQIPGHVGGGKWPENKATAMPFKNCQ